MNPQHFAREILHRLERFLFGSLPTFATERRQFRFRCTSTDVSLHNFNARSGHEDLRASIKFKREKLDFDRLAAGFRGVLHRERETEKSRDAVIAMHDVITWIEREKYVFRACAAQSTTTPTHHSAMEYFMHWHEGDSASNAWFPEKSSLHMKELRLSDRARRVSRKEIARSCQFTFVLAAQEQCVRRCEFRKFSKRRLDVV